VNPTAAVLVLFVSTLVVVGAVAVRDRVPPAIRDGLYVLGGAGLGLGSLLLQHDVTAVVWILTPFVMGGLALAHLRGLFAGTGPFRT
jgi:hypothetical protein